MRRPGLAIGRIYAMTEHRGDYHKDGSPKLLVLRAIRITDVQGDGSATGVVVRWRGRPRWIGRTVMLPDDARYELHEETILGSPRKVRRKSALRDHAQS